MTSAKGSIVVNELIIPITSIWLANRRMWFQGEAWGPIPASTASGYAIHDREGATLFRIASGIDGLTWPAVPRGQHLTVIAPIALHDVRPGGPSPMSTP